MPVPPRPMYFFGPFELRTLPLALYRGRQPVSITPKALSTLYVLVSRGGEAVSKEELLATVWTDTAVEESNLSQNVYTLRKLLASDFPDGTAIENIPRFGYRFTPQVTQGDGGNDDFVKAAVQADAGEVPSTSAPRASEAGDPPTVRRRPWSIVAVALLLVALLVWQWPALSSWKEASVSFTATRFTSNLNEDKVTAAAISPDGKLVAYADADGVVLRGTQDAALHLLPSPRVRVVQQLSWFPDQLHILLSGVNDTTGVPEIWKISVLREAPVLFQSGAGRAVPSHSGALVALTTADGADIWVTGSNGENSRRVASAGTGSRYSVLLWNVADDALLVQRRPARLGSRGREGNTPAKNPTAYEQVRLKNGEVTGEKPGMLMGDACLTATGQLIYSPVPPTGEQEAVLLREVSIDPDTGAMGTPRDLFRVPEMESHLFGFSCTATGDRVAAIRTQGAIGVFVGALSESNTKLSEIKRLSVDSDVAYAHGWTRDSRSILYEAVRAQGRWQIYSQSLERHDPELIVSMNGAATRPVLTPDGTWVLFDYQEVRLGQRTLYRVKPEGGIPSAVPGTAGTGEFRCPVTGGTCVSYFPAPNDEGEFSALDALGGKGRSLFRLPEGIGHLLDWDLSPDGGSLILNTQSVENPLHVVTLATGVIRPVAFHPVGEIKAVNWAAHGNGFFVALAAPSGDELTFLDAAGSATTLRTTSTSTWAIPSPDGKYISFNDRNLDSNVWLISRNK